MPRRIDAGPFHGFVRKYISSRLHPWFMNAHEMRALPRSGLKLTALGLGRSQLGGLYRPMSSADATALVEAA
jgi:hypothetical protein